MTKKDYVLLARALAQPIQRFNNDPIANRAARCGWAMTCENVSAALMRDNPRFNPEKFLKAAGALA